jgi:hypothetical protein
MTIREWLIRKWGEEGSYRRVAALVGTSVQNIHAWAHARTTPNMESVELLCAAMMADGVHDIDAKALFIEAKTTAARQRLTRRLRELDESEAYLGTSSRGALDEPLKTKDNGTADNTVGPNT